MLLKLQKKRLGNDMLTELPTGVHIKNAKWQSEEIKLSTETFVEISGFWSQTGIDNVGNIKLPENHGALISKECI